MNESNFEIRKSQIEPEGPSEKDEKVKDELAEAIEKKDVQLNEIWKNLREVIPRNRNFDIELEESESGVNIRLKHKENGQELDLGTFLLPEHSFGKDETFIYRGREKKVGFPENELKFRGFLLSLFHEIGHSHQKREHATTRLDDILAFGGFLKKWFKYVIIAIKKEREEKGSGKKFMEVIKKLDVDSLLPHWYLDKRARADAQAERNAWAYALRSLRQMERDGYNVFAGFENVAQIRAYVAYCLYTYDHTLLMKKLISGDVKDLQQLNKSPVFWKGSKKQNRMIIPPETNDESTDDES
jgi:hypothetical protein